MSARQLIVLVIAAVAAIGALLLIRGMGSTAENTSAEAVEPIAGEQVLVAARDVPQGAALTPSDVAVALFPESSLAPSFIRLSQSPSAQADFVGAVTRRAFAQGEPITLGSVVQPEGRGFLAAQLEPGFRAVALEIDAATAAGGFIQPNDRVDVIMTQKSQGEGGGEQIRSEIVLQDIRVLALGETTETQDEGEAPQRIEASVAVLELSQADARTLALADEMGDISLALRGVQVETVGMRGQSRGNAGLSQQNGSVRVHAFGSVSGGGR
ncbi:MAG: Flp pilus assembly protein CpaB [Hyphomonadaceae bacterium]